MELNFDEYESWDEFSVSLTRVGHKGFGKKGGTNHDKKVSQESVVSSEQTPINSVKEVIEKIKVATADLKQDEQEKTLASYADWIQRSLELGIVDYDANDVKADVNGNLVVMTHKPSTFFGMDSSTEVVAENRKKAEYKLFDRMERHLKDWQNCPKDFRDSTLKSLGADIKK